MKICLAGTGAMGEIHVKALAKIDGVEVVSVAGAHGRGREGVRGEVEYSLLLDQPRGVHRPARASTR